MQREATQKRREWGASGKGRYMENKRVSRAESVGAWRLRKRFFELYTLLATRFSLRTLHDELRETRRCVRTIVTALTRVLFAYLGFKRFGRVLTRFAARFLP